MAARELSWSEFWPYYLGEHRLPATRRLHVVGTVSYLALAAVATLRGPSWLFALCPIVAYGFAWFSHFAIEKNRPATFTYPLKSLWADHVMCAYFLTGRLDAELERHKIAARPAA